MNHHCNCPTLPLAVLEALDLLTSKWNGKSKAAMCLALDDPRPPVWTLMIFIPLADPPMRFRNQWLGGRGKKLATGVCFYPSTHTLFLQFWCPAKSRNIALDIAKDKKDEHNKILLMFRQHEKQIDSYNDQKQYTNWTPTANTLSNISDSSVHAQLLQVSLIFSLTILYPG